MNCSTIVYEGVYFVDLDRGITFWNRAAERLTGYEVGEMAGNLKHICRPLDIFGRWGGEEFVGLVRNVDLAKEGDSLRSLVRRAD